jgi:putative PIN family toxin of toxin-antitoxin system
VPNGMLSKPARIILDTNLWISFLITKNYSHLTSLIFSEKVVLIFSDELLAEFLDVVQRPKFKKYFSRTDVILLTEVIADYAEFVNVKTEVDVCRDAKDNFLLSLAIDGKADYLISGDNDLLEVKDVSGTKIITISQLILEINA